MSFSVMKLSADSPTAFWVQWKLQRIMSFFCDEAIGWLTDSFVDAVEIAGVCLFL
jgi:hypothetical protein